MIGKHRFVKVIPCVFVAAALTVLPTGGQPAAQIQPGATLVITGGTLIDGTDRGPVKNATVVIRNQRIEQVVLDGSRPPLPPGSGEIKADGKFIVPGLIDSHVHYRGWAGPLYLAHGVTTIFDAGNWTAWILAQRFAVAGSLVPGPRIFAAGGTIDGTASTLPHAVKVSSEAEAREAVRRHVKNGVDFIKAYRLLSPPLLRAIIEEAHAAGLAVRGDIAVNARDAAEYGIDSLEHLSGIQIATIKDPEMLRQLETRRPDVFFGTLESPAAMDRTAFPDMIRLLIAKGVALTPTLALWRGVHPRSLEYEQEDREFVKEPRHAFIPELERRGIVLRFAKRLQDPKFKVALSNIQAFVRAFAEAGGTILAGSDSSFSTHGLELHRELQLLVDAGLTPMQALQSATRNPARVLRKGSELGTIEPGKLADLLIVTADPLAAITNLRKIETVIRNGQILDTAYSGDFIDLFPWAMTEDFRKMVEEQLK